MKLKILVVDDDKRLLYVLKSLLMEENHEVTACQDGMKAIKKCREEKFDLIITDLIMPGAGGMEVLKESRKIHPETLVHGGLRVPLLQCLAELISPKTNTCCASKIL